MSCRISSQPSAQAITALVPWSEFDYGILESPWSVRFVELQRSEPGDLQLETYSAGTLFGLNAELRWRRRRNGRFHLVLIHDQGKMLENEEGLPLEPAEVREGDVLPKKILLWKPSDEPRIPRTIEYPGMVSNQRPEIHVKHYWLKDETLPPSSPVLIMRCVRMESRKEKP